MTVPNFPAQSQFPQGRSFYVKRFIVLRHFQKLEFHAPADFFAAATMFSTVKPKCFSSTPMGAEAPKPHMPMNWPVGPMYRSQPCLTPSSTATRRVTDGGRTASR